MQFTPAELKTIERLRKQQRQWPFARWAALTTQVGFAVLLAFVLKFEIHSQGDFARALDAVISLQGQTSPESGAKNVAELLPALRENALEFACLFPVWLAFAALVLGGFISLILNWRGHTEKWLLLKLVDGQQNGVIRRERVDP